ncbi:MAG: hypothetical protein Aurels2KO_08350 [Aureliella sp.]
MRTCFALALVIAAGLASRSFDGWLPEIFVANAGDFLWTVAAYLAIAIVCPRLQPLWIGLAALLISVAVEFSQLIDLPWLNALRRTLPGRLLLGKGFVGIDLLRYFAGACTATLLDALLGRWILGRQLPGRRQATDDSESPASDESGSDESAQSE